MSRHIIIHTAEFPIELTGRTISWKVTGNQIKVLSCRETKNGRFVCVSFEIVPNTQMKNEIQFRLLSEGVIFQDDAHESPFSYLGQVGPEILPMHLYWRVPGPMDHHEPDEATEGAPI